MAWHPSDMSQPHVHVSVLPLTQSPSSAPTLGRSTVLTYMVYSSRSREMGVDNGFAVNSWARRDTRIVEESFCWVYEEG